MNSLSAEHVVWREAEYDRPAGGRYVIVANRTGRVGFARYKPVQARWVFPSAQMAFAVTHWMYLPEAPR